MSVRSLAAPAVLLLVLAGGSTAWAQDDEAEFEAQLCAAATVDALNGILAADGGVGAVGKLGLSVLADVDLDNDPDTDPVAQVVEGGTVEQFRTEFGCADTSAPPDGPDPSEPPAETPPSDTDTLELPETVYYADCADAPGELLLTDPGYRVGLDSDGDGLACEVTEDTTDDTDDGSDATVGGADLSQGIETGI